MVPLALSASVRAVCAALVLVLLGIAPAASAQEAAPEPVPLPVDNAPAGAPAPNAPPPETPDTQSTPNPPPVEAPPSAAAPEEPSAAAPNPVSPDAQMPATAGTPAETPPGAPPPAGAPTTWEPVSREAERAAEGSVRVCEALLLPLSILPAVGSVIGTAAEWVCIIPAVMASDYVATHHGDRAPYFWQAAIALVGKQLWGLLVETPVLIAVVLAGAAALGVGAVASFTIGLPITFLIAGTVIAATVAFLGGKVLRDRGGDLIFQTLWEWLTPTVSVEENAAARERQWIQPEPGFVVGTFSVMATAAGQRPRARLDHFIPVAGPIFYAGDLSTTLKGAMRRHGREVLHEDKTDLGAMDFTIDVLAGSRGWLHAGSHVCIGAGAITLASAVAVWNSGDQQSAEILGGVALGIGATAAGLALLGEVPKHLRPLLIPAAYALGE